MLRMMEQDKVVYCGYLMGCGINCEVWMGGIPYIKLNVAFDLMTAQSSQTASPQHDCLSPQRQLGLK